MVGCLFTVGRWPELLHLSYICALMSRPKYLPPWRCPHVWPRYFTRSVNPKGVAPVWLKFSTFLAIRWCSTSSLSSILVQFVSLFLGTSTCINLLCWSVLGLACPLIWRPIFLHDICAVSCDRGP
jgi:hypothetical protein